MASRVRLMVAVLVGSLLLAGGGSVLADPPAQASVEWMLVAARTDLESLANELIGAGLRPPGWTNTFDVSADGFIIDLRLDLETLAGNVIAPDQRPDGWFGAVRGTPWAVARDIRHDLELLADTQLGQGVRPVAWIGGEPLMRCSRALQATVTWLERTNPAFSLSAPVEGLDYCQQSAQEVDIFVEVLLPPMMPAGDARADLNALYQAVLGAQSFPAEWSGSGDANGVRQDLEYMRQATAAVGIPITPANWFGPTFGTEWVVARANRHDLEVLADAKIGFSQRPGGWTYSGSALVRCPRGVQNLLSLLQTGAGFAYDPGASDPGFCQQLEVAASGFVESGAAGPGSGGGGVEVTEGGAPGGGITAPVSAGTAVGGIPGHATTPNAYLDARAQVQIGVIPRGTPLTALARSSAENSRMMYVQGEGFHVWVAWPWTTLTEQQYLSLPYAEDVRGQLPQLLCYANWCTQLVRNGSPFATAAELASAGVGPGYAGVGVPGSNLREVYDANVRLFFDVDNINEYWAEFRAELCGTPREYYTCEPGLRLYEFGQLVQPVRVVNGYPVWRLRYNLHETARLESRSYVKIQLWVSHPYDPR